LINPADSSNYLMPLHTLCRHKQEKFTIVKKILGCIKKLETNSSNTGFTMNTTADESTQLIDQILRKEDSTRQTILHIAIENNHLHIVELLFSEYNLSRELRDSQRGNLPIHVCAKSGSIEMFKLLQM
jgi:hypothetical protein